MDNFFRDVMMGDESLMGVFQEQCVLMYRDNLSLTWRDVQEMVPYERSAMLDMFKTFDEELEKRQKDNKK